MICVLAKLELEQTLDTRYDVLTRIKTHYNPNSDIEMNFCPPTVWLLMNSNKKYSLVTISHKILA